MGDPELESVTRCDLCGGERIDPLFPRSRIVRCSGCGHVFDSPRPTQAAIRAFYSKAGKYDSWVRQEEARRGLWRHRTAIVRGLRSGGRLLDVGAGIGEFLAEARTWFQVEGTEVSSEAVREARERFGLELRHGALEEVGFEGPGFDVVTLFHVLEHVTSPSATLERCRDLLAPGGLLVVAVPNEGAPGWYKATRGGARTLAAMARGGRFFRGLDLAGMPPMPGIDLAGSPTETEVHLHHFSPEVLCPALESRGWEVLSLGIDPYRPAAGWRRIAYRMMLAPFQLFHRLAGVLAYETMLVVARKPGC